MNTLYVLILFLIAMTPIPEDKCPSQFEEPFPQGKWECWSLQCQGHEYAIGGLGCKTNLIRQVRELMEIKANPKFEREKYVNQD
jgi:hypothetical protein